MTSQSCGASWSQNQPKNPYFRPEMAGNGTSGVPHPDRKAQVTRANQSTLLAISGEISILIQTGAESWERFPVPRICRWDSKYERNFLIK